MQSFVQDGSTCFVNISDFCCALELRRKKNQQNNINLALCNLLNKSEKQRYCIFIQSKILLISTDEKKKKYGYFLNFLSFSFSLY